jgi:parallel beta-helix repeat protein
MQYNTIKNCYDVNENHDDGIQSWTTDGVPIRRVVLRGNLIIESEDPNRPLRGHLQGIGCFDGMFEDWIVENNVVLVSHWHGITLLGARNCRIINNTAVDPFEDYTCWIRVGNHKDGTESEGCVVRNNITELVTVEGVISSHQVDHNHTLVDPTAVFVDYQAHDVHLREGSPAIDAGSLDLAPTIDILGNSRPLGAGIDIGAHEFIPASVRILSGAVMQ